jgi:hypothetical protein
MPDTFDTPRLIGTLLRFQKAAEEACASLIPAGGLFSCLPTELIFSILDASPISTWRALAQCCGLLRDVVTQRAQDYCALFGFIPHKMSLGHLVIIKKKFFAWPHDVAMQRVAEIIPICDTLVKDIGSWNSVHAPHFLQALVNTPIVAREMLVWAAKHDSIDMLRHLVDERGVTRRDIIEAQVIPSIVENNHFEFFKCLFEYCHLTLDDARHRYKRAYVDRPYTALTYAICYHHMCFIHYLFDVVGLTSSDVLTEEALGQAISSGYLDAVKYLFTRVGLTKSQAQNFDVFRRVGERLSRYLDRPFCREIIQFLFDTVGFTAQDVRDSDYLLVHGAITHSHVRITKYMFKKVGLTKQDVMANEHRLLHLAAVHCKRILSFLIRRFFTTFEVEQALKGIEYRASVVEHLFVQHGITLF